MTAKTDFFELSTLGDQRRQDLAFLGRIDTRPVEHYDFNRGRSVGTNFRAATARFEKDHAGTKLAPLLGNTDSLLVVREEVKEVIARVCAGSQIEYLPISIENHQGVVVATNNFIVHPVGHFDGINPVASEVVYYSDGTANTYDVIMDNAKVASAPPLFRVPEATTTFVIRSVLVDALRELPQRDNLFVTPIQCEEGGPGSRTFPQSAKLLSAAREKPSDAKLEKMKELLAAGADPNFECKGETPLANAIAQNDLAALALLLDSGADPNRRCTEERVRPLQAVARTGTLAALELLVARGAKVDPDAEGKTSLIPALIRSHNNTSWHAKEIPALLECLVAAGADVNRTDDGWTALGIAIWEGHDAYVEQLLALGADVNAPAGFMGSDRPLHLAASKGSPAIVELLLGRGADPDGRNASGKTALEVAKGKKVKAILANLGRSAPAAEETEPPASESEVKGPSAQKRAAARALAKRFPHHAHVLRAIAAGELEVDQPDGTGQPFLHVVCQDDSVAEVKAFVEELGADPRIQGRGGLRPIHEAVRSGSAKVVAYLLDRTSDASCSDNDFGATPLHLACDDAGSASLVRLLLERGADPNAVDGQGWPPIAFAMRDGKLKIVEMLLTHGAKVDLAWPNGADARKAAAESTEKMKALIGRFSGA